MHGLGQGRQGSVLGDQQQARTDDAKGPGVHIAQDLKPAFGRYRGQERIAAVDKAIQV